MERTYAPVAITTVRGIWWLLAVLVVVGVNVVVLYGVRTHAYEMTVLAGIWIVGVAVGSIRTLRELPRLDPGEAATQLAFRLAIMQPVLGIVPVILLLLP